LLNLTEAGSHGWQIVFATQADREGNSSGQQPLHGQGRAGLNYKFD
jgi:hypothetical protein